MDIKRLPVRFFQAFLVLLLLLPVNLNPALIHGVAAAPATGKTFQVNTTLDTPSADPSTGTCADAQGHCSLRAAVMVSNFLGGANTIVLPAGVYTLTRPGVDDAALVGDLDIATDLTIQGAGSAQTIVDANGAVTGDRAFQILDTASNVDIEGLTIRNGTAPATGTTIGSGGGLYLASDVKLTLNGVVIENNSAQNGGGIYASFPAQGGTLLLGNVALLNNKVVNGGVGAGGGLFLSVLGSTSEFSMLDSQVNGNSADGTGGGLFISGTDLAHGTIARSQINNNSAASAGGLGNFMPMTLSDSQVHGNKATVDGGAIEAFSPLAIQGTTLDANTASRYGGGIFSLATGNSALYNDFLNIDLSTLNNNSAKDGGAIYHDGYINYPSVMTLTNTTISSNDVSRWGGGINIYQGQALLSNTTVVYNHVQLRIPNTVGAIGGGLYVTGPSSLTMYDSLVSNNNRGNGILIPFQDDCYTNTSAGSISGGLSYNLIGTMTNCYISGAQVGTISGVNPLVGPLQDNGGLTFTHELLSGSPAIDAGENATCPPTDQRGVVRPFNFTNLSSALCDIGAYEAADNLSQTITFGPIPSEKYSGLPVAISATDSSGLPVAFSSTTPAVCAVAPGGLFDGVTPGSVKVSQNGMCSIEAQQTGNSTFVAATPVTQTFYVTGDLFLPYVNH